MGLNTMDRRANSKSQYLTQSHRGRDLPGLIVKDGIGVASKQNNRVLSLVYRKQSRSLTQRHRDPFLLERKVQNGMGTSINQKSLTSSSSVVKTVKNLNEISGKIIDVAMFVHRAMGPGLLESVYETILETELQNCGLEVQRQKEIPITWKGRSLGQSFRIDLLVEGCVVVELKSVEKFALVHKKQVLTYLKLSGLHLGLLLNFGAVVLKEGIERIVLGSLETGEDVS